MENNKKEDENNSPMAYFIEDGTFIVELKFNKPNENTAHKLLHAALFGEEILPDLKLEKLYRGTETSESVLNIKKREFLDTLETSLHEIMSDIKYELSETRFQEIKPSEDGCEYVTKR